MPVHYNHGWPGSNSLNALMPNCNYNCSLLHGTLVLQETCCCLFVRPYNCFKAPFLLGICFPVKSSVKIRNA